MGQFCLMYCPTLHISAVPCNYNGAEKPCGSCELCNLVQLLTIGPQTWFLVDHGSAPIIHLPKIELQQCQNPKWIMWTESNGQIICICSTVLDNAVPARDATLCSGVTTFSLVLYMDSVQIRFIKCRSLCVRGCLMLHFCLYRKAQALYSFEIFCEICMPLKIAFCTQKRSFFPQVCFNCYRKAILYTNDFSSFHPVVWKLYIPFSYKQQK